MNELSLFTGAGGGILGSKILGWRSLGYVEYERYPQEVISQRIADGILDAAPIFGDIRKFISDGHADAYQGMVDIVTGGFPCQPFSVAGRGLGEADPRNMWPETLEVIRRVRPRFVFLENVPGLMGKPYFRTILRQIAESGYDCRWCVLGASDVGANHRRKRLWILGYPRSNGCSRERGIQGFRKNQKEMGETSASALSTGQDVADSEQKRLQAGGEGRGSGISNGGQKDDSSTTASSGNGTGSNWWLAEPAVGRVAHGVANRVDRLKAIGNGQVPLCMAYAFSKLSEGIIE